MWYPLSTSHNSANLRGFTGLSPARRRSATRAPVRSDSRSHYQHSAPPRAAPRGGCDTRRTPIRLGPALVPVPPSAPSRACLAKLVLAREMRFGVAVGVVCNGSALTHPRAAGEPAHTHAVAAAQRVNIARRYDLNDIDRPVGGAHGPVVSAH